MHRVAAIGVDLGYTVTAPGSYPNVASVKGQAVRHPDHTHGADHAMCGDVDLGHRVIKVVGDPDVAAVKSYATRGRGTKLNRVDHSGGGDIDFTDSGTIPVRDPDVATVKRHLLGLVAHLYRLNHAVFGNIDFDYGVTTAVRDPYVFPVEDHAERDGTTWLQRKRAYLDHLLAAPSEILRVSLADKVHNAHQIVIDLRSDRGQFWQRFDKPSAPGTAKERQVWYYASLAHAFESAKNANGLRPWITELDHTVGEIEKMSGLTRGSWEPSGGG